MKQYKIELLLKISDEENNLLNNAEKVIGLFKLNDNFKICRVRNEKYYNLIFGGRSFNLYIYKESKNIYSITCSFCSPENLTDESVYLDCLTEVVREIKLTVLNSLKNCSYEVLWDDAGVYYAQLAFPEIIRIENLMRKLITKFMMASVGMDLFNNIPSDLKLREDEDIDAGFLHKIDFIDLTKYLFKPRPLKKQEELMRIIDSLPDNVLPSEVNLLDYKRESYWNRYFKDVVGNGIDADSIKIKWEELYKLRCKVAHSKFLKKKEYETIREICEKLNKTFSFALEKLSNINLSEESRETISEEIYYELEGKNWHEKLYQIIIRNFHDEFTLSEIYAFEPLFMEMYPENNTVRSSIRRNLQKLRDNGKIEFVTDGRYRILEGREIIS